MAELDKPFDIYQVVADVWKIPRQTAKAKLWWIIMHSPPELVAKMPEETFYIQGPTGPIISGTKPYEM